MITLAANGNIYKGYCVSLCLAIEERVELTDWNNYQSVAAVVGIATHDAFDGTLVEVQDSGIYENTTWTLTHNKPVYAFASGTITQDIPSKNVMKIGIAISPTKMIVRVSEFVMVTL